MIPTLALVILATDAPAVPGCADHWAVELDNGSFAANGAGRTFPPAELRKFRTELDARLKSAVGSACKRGEIRRSEAKAVERVQVFSASGATEPQLLPGPDGSLTLEWIFAEEGLAIPPAKDIIDGAACWTDPDSGACLAPGD